MTSRLQTALLGIRGMTASNPHAILDERNRCAQIAKVAFAAGLSTDEMRRHVHEAMNDRGIQGPYPVAKRENILIRIEAMMNFLAWEEAGCP